MSARGDGLLQRAAEILDANEKERDPKLSLAKCQLSAVPRRVLHLSHPLHSLDLSANKLRRLLFEPEDRVNNDCAEEAEKRVLASVRELNLALNKLASNDVEALAPLARWTGLTRLDLSGNGFSRLPPGFWDVLPRGLEELKLSYNCLSELPPRRQPNEAGESETAELSRLTTLHLDCNGLIELPEFLPRYCPNLTLLQCADNVLKSIPSSFNIFRGLTNLDLSGNRLSVLPADREFYSNLASSLVRLTLKDNLIKSLPDAFSCLTSLEVLNLRKNRLEVLEKGELDIPSLRDLDLSCNKLRSIELSERLSMLEILRIEHNQLEFLPPTICSLPALCRLYAHDNKLSTLSDQMIKLTQLKELDLARNKLVMIPRSFDEMMRHSTVTYYRHSLPDEVIPGLFIGGAESAVHLEALVHRNIRLVVQVLSEAEQHYPDQFSYLTYRILDHPNSDLSRYFQPCIERIAETLQNGSGVLVHCVAGISRSATIVAAFLMHHHKLSYDNAMSLLRRSRPSVNPNPGFIDQLRNFEQELFRTDSHQNIVEVRCTQIEPS